MHLRIAVLGYGNVGRALITMLAEKEAVLRERYDLTLGVTGMMARRAGGWLAAAGSQLTATGISPADVLASGWPEGGLPAGAEPFSGGSVTFATTTPCDVLIELTTLNAQTGQPALEHVREALKSGKSVVTANKGPIAHAY